MIGWWKRRQDQKRQQKANIAAYEATIATYVKPQPPITEEELLALSVDVAKRACEVAIQEEFLEAWEAPWADPSLELGPILTELFSRYESIGECLNREHVLRFGGQPYLMVGAEPDENLFFWIAASGEDQIHYLDRDDFDEKRLQPSPDSATYPTAYHALLQDMEDEMNDGLPPALLAVLRP